MVLKDFLLHIGSNDGCRGPLLFLVCFFICAFVQICVLACDRVGLCVLVCSCVRSSVLRADSGRVRKMEVCDYLSCVVSLGKMPRTFCEVELGMVQQGHTTTSGGAWSLGGRAMAIGWTMSSRGVLV